MIAVTDNGIGIAADQQEKVFAKYGRIDKAVEGSGIGLYLVKEMVTKSGGTITLKSEPGKGSEFRVQLIGR